MSPPDLLLRHDRLIAGALFVWATIVPAAGAAVVWATSASWLDALRATGDLAPWWLLLSATLLTGLSLIPSHVAALVCGYAQGAAFGSLLGWLAIGAAAVLGYSIARPLMSERAVRLLVHRPRAARVHAALIAQSRGSRIGLVGLLRLSPAMPFALTNFLMAAARVPFVDFQLGSWLGMTPRVIAVACAGAGLSELVDAKTSQPWLLGLGVVATLAAVWWIGSIARRALRARGVG